MCGIIGYSGICSVMPKIVNGLSALEYRGYDSAGVAFFEGDRIRTVKSAGRIENLKAALGDLCENENIKCGIGHTRWATHGEPSSRNSHPHGTERVMIVHNGIIENFVELKAFLADKGYSFESETDTEAAAKLIDFFYGESKNAVDAIQRARAMLRGSYAVCALFSGEPNRIYGFRKDNPLLAAPHEDGNFFASDISAVLAHTRRFRRLEENEIAVLDSKNITVLGADGCSVECVFETESRTQDSLEKCGFEHFMLKEIAEEPRVINQTIKSVINDGLPCFDQGLFVGAEKIHIVACGTAMHAGMLGKYVIERLSGIPVFVELASEFRYRNPILGKGDIVVLISQSGETADTLAALRLAKAEGARTLGIVNVVGSAVAREADNVIYTNAGTEVAVASTKAYSVQLAVLFLLAVDLGHKSGKLEDSAAKAYVEALLKIPDAVEKMFAKKDDCSAIAQKYTNSKSIFFMGRGVDYALSMEAALKMKEVSYIHCEGIAAGEMKHGTISLISEGVPVFVFATDNRLFEKTVSNIKEVRARGARVVLVCNEKMDVPEGIADDIIRIPETEELFATLVAAVPAQLLAYYMSCHLGLDVDKPRNLAKSVTVE